MKKLWVVFFSCYLCCNVFAQQAGAFPGLKTVVEKFDNNYYFSANNHELRLAKKPEGWVVYTLNREKGGRKKHNEQLFWSAQADRYYPLNFSRNHRGENNHPMHNAIKNMAFHYERNPYFGYNQWHWDVINEYSQQENLSDTLLESLGRAYATYAFDFFVRYFDYEEIGINNPLPGDEIPVAKADSFIKYADLEIATYRRLWQQNPYYETIVGNIYIKYCNEYMDAYLTLCEFGFEEKAQKYLVDGLYNPAFLSWARNYFHSVEDNAILITNGDNDTYPLLYIQLKENYKKKVNVINQSLLWRARYIQLVSKGYGGFAPVALTLRQEYYNIKKLDNIYMGTGGEGDTAKNVYELLEWVKRSYTAQTSETKSLRIQQNKLLMEINIINCKKLKIWDDKLKYPRQEISVDVATNLGKNHLALLDIIYTNDWALPVYFSGFTEGDGITIKPYLKHTGMAQMLSPHANNSGYYFNIDEKRLPENIFNKFSFIADTGFAGRKGTGFKNNVANLRYPYMYAAYHYKDKKDTTNCYKSIQKCITVVPDDYTPLDPYLRYLAFVLIEMNKKEDAEKLLITLCNNALEEYKSARPLTAYLYDAAREKADAYNIILDIEKIAATNNFDSLQQTTRAAINQLDTLP